METWTVKPVCPRVEILTALFRNLGKGKVKHILVQALRLCRGRMAHRRGRGIALLFIDHGTRRGWGVSVTPRPLYVGGNRWQRCVSNILCAFNSIKKKKLTASFHGVASFEKKKLCKILKLHKRIFFFCSQQENKNNIADPWPGFVDILGSTNPTF